MHYAIMVPMLTASIGDVARDAWDGIKGFLNDFISAIMDTTIISWLMGILKEFIMFLLTWSDNMYDKLINRAYSLLTQSPKEWSPDAWNVIKSINDTLISTIGITLVVVFFSIGFCKDSLDPRGDLRFENILKMFIKLSIASWFMYNSINIVASLFDLVNIVAGTNVFTAGHQKTADFFEKSYNSITVNGTYAGNAGLANLLIVVLMSFIYTIASVGVSAMIVYQAFTRFFKILVIIPYGSIASTSLAGDHQLSQTAVSFYKYALNCILEAATIVIALFIYSKITGHMPEALGLFNNPPKDMGDVMGYMLTQLILMMTMYGLIKQSSVITQRALGL